MTTQETKLTNGEANGTQVEALKNMLQEMAIELTLLRQRHDRLTHSLLADAAQEVLAGQAEHMIQAVFILTRELFSGSLIDAQQILLNPELKSHLSFVLGVSPVGLEKPAIRPDNAQLLIDQMIAEKAHKQQSIKLCMKATLTAVSTWSQDQGPASR